MTLNGWITTFGLLTIITALVMVATLSGVTFCDVFSFMDFNGPGPQDDLPFCWTPFEGVVR